MVVHRFEPSDHPSCFGGHNPVLTIAPGDVVDTTTVDAFGVDAAGRQVSEGDNPLTGPFRVEGASPGDRLTVHLLDVQPNRTLGRGCSSLVPSVVDPAFVPELPLAASMTWRVCPKEGLAHLLSGDGWPAMSLELRPMLGCVGVAPSHGQVIWSGTAGRYGGNMDYRRLIAGVKVHLPVFVPGALLYLGDGHALQGGGEISGAGVEISMDVRFTVSVAKGRAPGWPRGEDATSIWTIGNARPLEQALQHATTEMLRWLRTDFNLGTDAACVLLAHAGEYEVANVCDPAFSVVCKVPLSASLRARRTNE